MDYFVIGEKIEKSFWLTSDDGQPVSINEVVGVLYEYKSGKIIARFDDADNSPTYTNNVALFVITPEISRLCPPNVELWFDVAVINVGKIYRGQFGIGVPSNLSNEL